MRFFVLRSDVRAEPDRVWHEQVIAKGFLPKSGESTWPRSAVRETSSILSRRRVHERTVAIASNGVTIQDHVHYEARFQVLSPWLKASGIMSLRKEHEEFRAKYQSMSK